MCAVAEVYLGEVGAGMTCPQKFWVRDLELCAVKFLQNPQGPKALANELIGFALAEHLQLPCPQTGVVEVDNTALVEDVLEVTFDGDQYRFETGLHLYSQWLESTQTLTAKSMAGTALQNPEVLAGVAVLDVLINNFDRKPTNPNLLEHRDPKATITLIDLSMAFGNANWSLGNLQYTALPDVNAPLPYAGDMGDFFRRVHPHDMNPYLEQLAVLDEATLEAMVARVPNAWGITSAERKALLKYLYARVRASSDYWETRFDRTTKNWWL